MRFDERFLEEIKARLRPSDVIGRTVKLRRQGREYVGLSPFTKEKSPSFYVNDEKGFFHDFSSGKHGDLIAFLQETERLSFREAIERLAAEAGLALPTPDPREAEQDRRRQDLHGWMEEAARWFEAQLRRTKGEAARRYLDGRALPEAERARFRLGYAPADRTGLKDQLIAKGAKPGELVEAGLLIQPDDGGQPYDRFRDRIMFPITDARGRIVSFGGRALDPQQKAKYLNGPETALFHKGSTLYLLPEARRLLHTPGGEDAPLVVVEGYMDAIACQRAGVAAVAPLGTALTEEQMAALWRVHPSPTLCFDADDAGQRAEARAMDRALPLLKAGFTLKFATVLGGKDPDDILRERGAEALRLQMGMVRPFSQALFERERDRDDLSTADQRAAFKARLRKLAQSIVDRDLSEQYGRDFIDRFYQHFQRRRFDGVRFDLSKRIEGLKDKTLAQRLKARMRTFNAAVAVAAIENPVWVRPNVEELVRFGFGDARLAELVQPLIDAVYEENPTHEMVLKNIRSDGATNCLSIAYRFALEVDVYPFLGGKVELGRAREVWERSFHALMELARIESELEERRRAFMNLEPLNEDEQDFVERGAELRSLLWQWASAVSEGETVWMDR